MRMTTEVVQDLYTHNQPYYLVSALLTPFNNDGRPTKGFTLMQVLGEGSYAYVYFGHEWYYDNMNGWRQNDKRVAIKLLRHDHLTVAPERKQADLYSYGQQCMQDEADFLSRMQKNDSSLLHVPGMKYDGFGTVDRTSSVYESCGGPADGRLQSFLIMEYLPGGDLWTLVQEGTVFNELQAYYALEDILCSLQDLHAHGVCHRDLKPDNVAFEEDPRINPSARLRLIDLGHAADINRAPYDTVIGTTNWQAPEVVALLNGQSRQGFDESIDIYGAGMILGWLLSTYWDPVVQCVRHAPVEHAANHWMSTPAAKIHQLCVIDAPNRATLKSLRPMMKKWRQHLRREAHQEFDNCYRIQPEGRDCRLVSHTEQVNSVFEQFSAALPQPSRLRLSAIALRKSTGSSDSNETLVQTPELVQEELKLCRYPPMAPPTRLPGYWEAVAAPAVGKNPKIKEKAWWKFSLPIERGLRKLVM